MRLIVAPAKKMRTDEDRLDAVGSPVFLDRARELLAWLNARTPAELQRLWACSDAVAAEGMDHLAKLDLDRACTPAILAYDGIQYKYMAPAVFDEEQVAYVQEHLRILSGLYGVLRALDPVGPYRLEMQEKVAISGHRNLYDYWGSAIHDEVVRGDTVVVNLASVEYSRCVERHLAPSERFVTCVFGQLEGGKVVQKGVYAKMCRGEMVRYAADVQAKTPEDLKGFRRLGYSYDASRSTEDTYVYLAGSVHQ